MTNAQHYAVEHCERCESPLTPGSEVWLELNSRTGVWRRAKRGVRAWGDESQGLFPFGRHCAQVTLGAS